MPDVHSNLPPSASKMWISCPPSAALNAKAPDSDSSYALAGTLAHSIGEAKIRQALGEDLKDLGIEVRFEKENINSLSGDGELMLTILASFAQEESYSISENVKWGIRKRFEKGDPCNRNPILGYEWVDDKLVVVPEEAEIVKRIFRNFLDGKSRLETERELNAEGITTKRGYRWIDSNIKVIHLTEKGIKTPGGKDKWNATTIRRILTNEKYKGDALLQKEFTVDFLTKKTKKNCGEIPMYYIEDDHEAIIDPAVFDMVQQEMERRKTGASRYSGVSIFSSKIKCGECGGWYGAKVWHSTDQYRKVIYRCNNKYNDERCTTPHIMEEEVKTVFLKSLNKLLANRDELIENVKLICDKLTDTSELEAEKEKYAEEMSLVADMVQAAMLENARIALDQEEYRQKNDVLSARFEAAKKKHDELAMQIEEIETRGQNLRHFQETLESLNGQVTEFDSTLWGSLVDYITVYENGEKTVTFRDGSVI